MPERHDRLAAAARRSRRSARSPSVRQRSVDAERRDQAVAEAGDQRAPEPLATATRASRRAVVDAVRLSLLQPAVDEGHQVDELHVGAGALACAPFSMIEQNGQAVTTVSAPVACSCLKRTSLMREPGSSSLSANSSPPPAPQQYGFSRLRSGSLMSAPKRVEQRARLVDLAGVAPEIARDRGR